MKNENRYIIMCPPQKLFPIAPKDQPGCYLINCTQCGDYMWISTKKRQLVKEIDPKKLLIGCYFCIEEKVKANPSLFIHAQRKDI